MASSAESSKAAPIQLTDEGKLRLVYLLFMHQKVTPINYEGFEPGTGHSKKAIQGIMERLKKQYITDAKPGDGQATIATGVTTGNGKKRSRPAAKVAAPETSEEGDEEPPAKKERKLAAKKTLNGGDSESKAGQTPAAKKGHAKPVSNSGTAKANGGENAAEKASVKKGQKPAARKTASKEGEGDDDAKKLTIAKKGSKKAVKKSDVKEGEVVRDVAKQQLATKKGLMKADDDVVEEEAKEETEGGRDEGKESIFGQPPQSATTPADDEEL